MAKKAASRVLLLLLLLCLLLALLFCWRGDLLQLAGSLGRVSLLWFLAAVSLYFGGALACAVRWRVSLSYLGFRVGLRDLYLILFGSIFINNVTPFSRGGADPVGRVYLLGRTRRVPYSSALATTLVDHLFDFPVVLSFLMLGLLLGVPLPFSPFWLILLWSFLLFLPFLLVLGVVKKKVGVRKVSRFLNSLSRLLRRRRNFLGSVLRMYRSSEAILCSWCVGPILLSSLLIWTLDLLRLSLIFLALGYHPSLPMLLLATTLPTLAGLVPFLPGGLVLVEATMISVFTFFGVPFFTALLATLLERAISLVLSTVVGAGVLSYLGLRGGGKKAGGKGRG